VIPSIDLDQLASFVRHPDQHRAVVAYRDALSGAPRRALKARRRSR
jgi:hypothetical protein